MKTFRFLVILTLLGGITKIYAQSIYANNVTYIKDVETYFSQGVNEYRLGRYKQGKDIFARLINEYPVHQRTTICYLMLGKTYYKLGNYEKAIVTLHTVMDKYSQSNYVDDAHYALGCCYYQMDNFVPSVKEFLWITDYGKDKKLIEKSRNLVFKIVENNLTFKEIMDLTDLVDGESSKAIMILKLAQKWDNIGNQDRAVSLLQQFINEHKKNDYLAVMKEVLKKIQTQQKTVELKVGIILPLSSNFAEQAQSLLTGIRYAQKKFNKNSLVNIKLIIKDSEGNIINCIKAAQELVADDKIIAIIGELESGKTAAIAPVVDYHSVPLIVPVASENGLAALSEYVFQANGDLEKRGALLAEYAVKNLNHKTFATLAPADKYGKDMTDSFTTTIDKLNGTIIAQKWYYENTQDFARQFKSIRELGFNYMNKDSLYFIYTKNMSPLQKAKFREETIPITSIDAIFFPIYTEDIKYVVPQFAFVNIQAQIFGGLYWYDIEELREKNIIAHVNNIIFESDYYLDDVNPEFQNFRSNFRKEMGTTPEEMECYGYDAMSLIVDAIAHNTLTRESCREYLNNLENFKGIRGSITFKNNNRVNSEQRLITFKNGRFVLLK